MEHVNSHESCSSENDEWLGAALNDSRGSSRPRFIAQAHGMVMNMVQRQATMLAFLDNFKLLGIIFFAVIPIMVLLKRRPKMGGGAIPVHYEKIL